jgi:ATP-dependent metalloprotease FtsH
VVSNRDVAPQWHIAQATGISQMSVSEWQRGVSYPRSLSKRVYRTREYVPQNIEVTPEFMRLIGYYLAEGHTTEYYTQWVFGAHEKNLHEDCQSLIESIFNLKPRLEYTEDNALRITVSSVDIARLFSRLCNTGSKNKKLPSFVWNLPYVYFLELLRGYSEGDGYISKKEGKLIMSSVSRQLITELAWLCNMHGINVGMEKKQASEGRVIKKKPLASSTYWLLTIGKSANPFITYNRSPKQFKKPVITEITKQPYNDYVYDLCGCDNEAFFGGDKPVLLHNTRVRDTFEAAKKTSPAIIFIDEIDAVGRHRGAGLGGGHDEREQTLNQILVEMDGFDTNEAVIVVAATNRPDILDPALLRPGRFDRRIVLSAPTIDDREAILKIHAQGKPFAKDVNLRVIAERTPGYAGADLANILNEGAILAARTDQTEITQDNLIKAIEKVMMGPEKKSHAFNKKEKEIAAYHEAGHAIVAAKLPNMDPVHKVSIISRGMAGGYTLKLPSEDKHLRSKKEFESELAVLLGGYSAEQIMYKDITTGASNDLEKASQIAREMITRYGMSDKLGPVVLGDQNQEVFLGRDMGHIKNYSDEIAYEIDLEVRLLINGAVKKAHSVIKQNMEKLNTIAKELIEKEVLEQQEFYALLRG